MYRALCGAILYIFLLERTTAFSGVAIGDPCLNNADCDGFPESTICADLIGCYCNNDHVPVRNDTITCEKIRQKIGEPCKIKEQCTKGEPGDLSDCLPSLDDPHQTSCNCTEEAIHEPGQHKCHIIRNMIGDLCEVNAQCSFSLTEWGQCSNGECNCRPGSVSSIEQNKCLPIRHELGSECSIGFQCTMGTPGGYSDCMETFQSGKSDNASKFCNCTDIAISEPGDHTCYLRRENLGQPCKVDAQCNVNMGSLTRCQDTQKCTCIEGLSVPNHALNYCLEIVNEVNRECKESQQCTEGVPGSLSSCMPSYDDELKMVCNCTDDAINQPGKNECLKKAVLLGDPCIEEVQCRHNLGVLSECHIPISNINEKGFCRCINGSISKEEGNYCVAIRQKLGDQCDEARQCQSGIPGYHSTCSNGKCDCSIGATNEPGEHFCRERANNVGAPCQVNSQCKANLGELSECLRGEICICTPIFAVPNINGTNCLPVINSIDGRCNESQQCQTGDPGKFSDCRPSSIVPDSLVCNCTDGATRQEGHHTCYKIAQHIGEECTVLEQCQSSIGALTECTADSQCQCISNRSIPNSYYSKCLPIINTIGHQCLESIQCTMGVPGKLSECRLSNVYTYEFLCLCKPETIQHPSGQECLQTAITIEDTCSHDNQCTTNLGTLSKCDTDGRCRCMSGSVPNLEGQPFSKCIPGGVFISKECFDKGQCVGIPDITSTCSYDKVCGCLENYTQSNDLDDCLPVRNFLGDICEEPQQCQQGVPGKYSECTKGSDDIYACKCTKSATNEAGRHVCYLKAVFVGDPCESNVQCISNLQQSQCLNGHCECMKNSTAAENGMKCLPKAYIGQPCQDNHQCSHVVNATCLKREENGDKDDSTCQCDKGYMNHPTTANTCIKMALNIGDSCELDAKQCNSLGGATCRQNMTPSSCQCNFETEVISSNHTACLQAIYELHLTCLESVQCQTQNSICVNVLSEQKSCSCKTSSFVESIDSTKCLPVTAKIGHPCEDSRQCESIGLHIECISGLCLCLPPYDNYADTCFVPARLGGHCDTNQQCHLGVNEFSVCDPDTNLCTCVETAYQVADSCWAVKIVGDNCIHDVECTIAIIGQVHCNQETKSCNCDEGYKADTGGIRCSSAYSMTIIGANMICMFCFVLSTSVLKQIICHF